MDRQHFLRTDITLFVHRVTEHVHDATQGLLTDRYLVGITGIQHRDTALEAVCRAHGDGTYHAVTELLLHLEGQARCFNLQGIVHLRYAVAGELHVDHRADDFNNVACTHDVFLDISVFCLV